MHVSWGSAGGDGTSAMGLVCIPLAASPADPHRKDSQGDLIFTVNICFKAAPGWLLLYRAAAVELRTRLAAFSAKCK